MELKGKKALVVGMRASGISAAYLLRQSGAEVFCYDDNQKLRLKDFIFLHSGSPKELIAGKDLVVVSPSISKFHPIVEYCERNKIEIISELELGCRFLDCKKVMITGTNGKTTCVTMLEKLLTTAGIRAKAMGNIGYPVSQVVLDGTKLDAAVIEVSSFQLEHVEALHADIAVILNLAPDHLDRYSDYKDYIETKKRICLNQNENDRLFFNSDDGAARQFLACSKARAVAVSARARLSPVYVRNNFFMLEDRSICHLKDFKLRGEHNRFNLLMTLNVGHVLGVRREFMCKMIREYALPPNRIEYVTTIKGINYYNDSKGTNIHACRCAIAGLDGTIGLIMGGSDKNEDFCDFFENIDDRVKYIAVTGANSEKIFDAARKMGYGEAAIFPDMKDCVEYLSRKEDLDNVLLSPCSASFDRYGSYEDRGNKFKEIVYEIEV